MELRLDGIWVCSVAALIEAVLRAVLPHPAHVLDWIIIVRDAVIVDLGNTVRKADQVREMFPPLE